jgi:hypothetical protein
MMYDGARLARSASGKYWNPQPQTWHLDPDTAFRDRGKEGAVLDG